MNLKQALLCGAEIIGLNSLARFRTRCRLLGLCYHSVVSDNSPMNDARARIAVTVSQFDEQLHELKKHWNPVSLNQIRDAVEKGIPLPDYAVYLSFDDGYRNNLTLAAPLLTRYEIPATIFVTTNLIATDNQLIWALELHERLTTLTDSEIYFCGKTYNLPPPETPQRTETALDLLNQIKHIAVEERINLLQFLRDRTEIDLTPFWKRELYDFLNWGELRLLIKQGISIGAHTLSHPILSNLDQVELDNELLESKKCIERELGVGCDVLAYPFGSVNDFSERVIDAARRIGFRLAFTLQDCRNAPVLDAMRIHRICIHREHSINSFRALISGLRDSRLN
ncbi:MAG: polysaccharide deacetylase family protein [Planctomycetaceae bacterium]|jgi:peptidoglycan/xylan/chitin deacetylase (PgdA/CDA1 family)|nr:polysaccharide deacetylase family protein [Planctomycetaceae bacterium]